ncbi:hypothetical protein D3C77_757770 [compost metagenome]
MINVPKMIFCRFSTCPASISPAGNSAARFDSRTGNSTMNAAPRKLPRMLPRPPMMMMNRIWNERFRSKPCGSTVPK